MPRKQLVDNNYYKVLLFCKLVYSNVLAYGNFRNVHIIHVPHK